MAKLEPGVNDFQTLSPDIAKELHPTLNGDLKASDIHNESNKCLWWLCPRGHSYQKVVAKRTARGQNCPVCRLEDNSFAHVHPELLKYWDYEKNVELDPESVFYGSGKKAWWICEEGNSYPQMVNAKSRGTGCPICTHQQASEETCLATVNPEIAKEWHPTKNGYFKPIHVTPKSGKRVWWLCPECGNEWTQYIKTRNNGKTARKCPVCANNQKKTNTKAIDKFNPILFKEWHSTKNGDAKLEDYTPGSRVKVWWVCSVCGREFECSLKNRKNGGGCIECGRKRTNAAKHKKVRNINTNEIFESIYSAASAYDISRNGISDCLHGRAKTAGGYRWELVIED